LHYITQDHSPNEAPQSNFFFDFDCNHVRGGRGFLENACVSEVGEVSKGGRGAIVGNDMGSYIVLAERDEEELTPIGVVGCGEI
jgi:hypothetical protein